MVLEQSQQTLMRNKGIGEKIAKSISHQYGKLSHFYYPAESQLLRSEEVGSYIIDIIDPKYPNTLLNSKMPVPVLHIRGNIDLLGKLEKTIAIVGSRKISRNTTTFIRSIVPELVKDGWAVISGMAFGVDGEAHSACLNAGGITVGVLGSGVDVVYPTENESLYTRMLRDAILVSEYGLGSRVSEIKLKRRNRIIAGLSMVVLVVQTLPDGGSMNAVRAAYENRIPVLAYNPTELINDKNYSGNKYLIDSGKGFPVTDYRLVSQLKTIMASLGLKE